MEPALKVSRNGNLKIQLERSTIASGWIKTALTFASYTKASIQNLSFLRAPLWKVNHKLVVVYKS